MNRPRTAFIVLAGGSGRRFGGYKPVVRLAGRPLLYWSFKNIAAQARLIDAVALAAPRGWTWERFRRLGAVPSGFPFKPLIVPGGETRFASLSNVLTALKQRGGGFDAFFAHDAARPLWPSGWISEMLDVLRHQPKTSAVIPVIPVRETVKYVNGLVRTIKQREFLRFSQTPQLVRWPDFESACRRVASTEEIFDEAYVLEKSRRHVAVIPGHFSNIKVTYPQDADILKALWHVSK